MKLSDLIDASAISLSKLSKSEIRQAYQIVKSAVRTRSKTFVKHGKETGIPKWLRGGLPSSVGAAPEDLALDLKKALGWLHGENSKYAGYLEMIENRRRKMQEAMPDMDFSTVDKLEKFGHFMEEIRDKYGDMAGYVSTQAQDFYNEYVDKIGGNSVEAGALYGEAMRLNVDPRQFVKNFEFWMQNLEELKEIDPINQRKGSRALKASDYAQKIERKRQRRGRR